MVVSKRRFLFPALAAGACAMFVNVSCVNADDAPEGSASTKLEMNPTKLDFEGNRELKLMYMPGSITLSETKPEWVKKEPAYKGKVRYGIINLGNTDKKSYAIAFEWPEKDPGRVFADLNGNGDLSDDSDGSWGKIDQPTEEGKSPQYSSTLVFAVNWKNADGTTTQGPYGVNFYASPDRDKVNFYRAAARVGEITINNKKYEVVLYEDDCDGIFNKLYDSKKPVALGEPVSKPVFLMLDGDRFDIRGTFGFNDINYIAKVSEDGANLTLEPTYKTIRPPRPQMKDGETSKPLGAGGNVPEFEFQLWNAEKPEEPKTVNIKDYAGKKILIVDFWATWCGPCMAGLPHLSKIAEQVKGQDVEVIALNSYDDKVAYERYANAKGKTMHFTLARDPAGRESDLSVAKRLFNIRGIPQTYVIDKTGKIVAAVSGYNPDDKSIEQALKALGVKIE